MGVGMAYSDCQNAFLMTQKVYGQVCQLDGWMKLPRQARHQPVTAAAGNPQSSTASLTDAVPVLPQTVTPDYPDMLPRPMETSPTAASVNMPPVEDA
jgi:hypothetical protein